MADNVTRFGPRPQLQQNASETGTKAANGGQTTRAAQGATARPSGGQAEASTVALGPKKAIKTMAKSLVASLKAPAMLGSKKAASKAPPWPAKGADFSEPNHKAALQGVFDHALKLMDTHAAHSLYIVRTGLKNVDNFMTPDTSLRYFTGSKAQVSHWLACELEAMASALSRDQGAVHQVAQALRREPLGQQELRDLAAKLPLGSPAARLELMQEHARH